MTVVRPGWKRPHCVWLLVANALLFDGPLLFLHGIAQKGDDSERAIQKVAADALSGTQVVRVDSHNGFRSIA